MHYPCSLTSCLMQTTTQHKVNSIVKNSYTDVSLSLWCVSAVLKKLVSERKGLACQTHPANIVVEHCCREEEKEHAEPLRVALHERQNDSHAGLNQETPNCCVSMRGSQKICRQRLHVGVSKNEAERNTKKHCRSNDGHNAIECMGHCKANCRTGKTG